MSLGRRVLAALAVTLSALVAGTAGPATAQDPGTDAVPEEQSVLHSWALGPTGSADPGEPGNRQSLTYDAAPGSVIQDSITLYNFGTAALPFRIYATDAFNTPDGSVDLLGGDEQPTDAGAWVTVLEERLQLEPGTQATIPITITVPADARPGDHVGAILASSPVPGRGPNGAVISVDRRTGPELVVRVQGPAEPSASVEGLDASYTPSINPLSGSAEVTYTIRNTGNVRLKGTHHVTMGGVFGLGGSQTPPVEIEQLLPGESIEVTVPVEGVPASVLSTATVDLETSAVEGDQVTTTASASTTTLAPPVSLLAVALVVILVLVAQRRFRRHGRERSGPGSSGPGGLPPSGSSPSGGGHGSAEPTSRAPRVLEPQA